MTAPATCLVSGTAYAIDGTAQSGVLVRARVVASSTWPVSAGSGVATGDPEVAYTDGAGSWSLTLPQGLYVWLEIPSAGVDHFFLVPSDATANFSGLSLSERTT